MAGFDDIAKKAQEFLKDPKVEQALHSEQAEGVSDKLLDAVAGAADKATGGKFHDQIDQAKKTADEKIGDK
ncbi:Rv0909 family putative TA system antitoxin [Frondihabitans australicus]|uniref:Antitoxin protein of toxin-antitoxin system n=1 Tax=Frondihabitans australicus TaxID=386892 RepID=A0A495IKX0_9MICO|nr:Rv0909 family putative TA system antitoxin [Frondihabitans australicus]RKR76078.1 antitoxin protein of toxin-antitoxin system [Frondihabitans australicus]